MAFNGAGLGEGQMTIVESDVARQVTGSYNLHVAGRQLCSRFAGSPA